MRFVSLICLLLVTGCLSSGSKEKDVEGRLGELEKYSMVKRQEYTQFFADADSAEEHGWNEEAIQHFALFQSALSTNQETARAELRKVASARFETHPLTDKWVESCLRLGADDGASFLDIKRFFELELQLLTDTDAKAYVKGIRNIQGALDHFNVAINVLENQGQDPSKIKAEVEFKNLFNKR